MWLQLLVILKSCLLTLRQEQTCRSLRVREGLTWHLFTIFRNLHARSGSQLGSLRPRDPGPQVPKSPGPWVPGPMGESPGPGVPGPGSLCPGVNS